jgi:hypothetical protein
LFKAIDTLQTRPMRCPVAAENDKFPEEIRELLYGKSSKGRHRHRIIFTICGDTVHILLDLLSAMKLGSVVGILLYKSRSLTDNVVRLGLASGELSPSSPLPRTTRGMCGPIWCEM